MEFNPEKCKVIHFVRSNLTRKYSVNNMTRGGSEEQSDLGVFVRRSLQTEGGVVKKALLHTRPKNIGEATAGALCAVLVITLQEGCDCTGRGAEEIHQDAAWDGTFKLRREVG